MLTKRKRAKFASGEILEIPLNGGLFGYAQVVRDDNFAAFIVVFDILADKPLSCEHFDVLRLKIKTRGYVNNYSARQNWKHLCEVGLSAEASKIPTLFFGSTTSGWTVESPDGVQTFVSGSGAKRSDFLAKDYVQKIMWLAQDYENLLQDNQPLDWKGSE